MKYVPYICVWEITLACCFSCKYCGSSGGKARENELTTAECLDVADQLAELGCQRVALIGGEVFMRRDWAEIVRRLTGRGVRVSIITNGWLFRDELIGQMKALGIEPVAVSVDAPKDAHDRYRQTGSFDRAMEAIKRLGAAGIPVSVISTLNAESARRLEETYALLRPLPIFAWQIQACSPMGNAAKLGVDYRFDFGEVIRFVSACAQDAPFRVGVADNIGYEMGETRVNGGSRYHGCAAGLTVLGIDSVGNVRGCESLYDERFNEGNLRQRRLRDIWEDPDSFAYNRRFTPDLLTGPCAECPEGPWCAGGCRSYDYFVHGKLYENPACARWCKGQ